MKHAIIALILVFFNCIHTQDPLSALTLIYKTDKGPQHHNYTPLYDSYFSKFRNQNINFLEVGFFHGDSAHMWQEYFYNAQLHFIDINENFFNTYGKELTSRCHLHIVDQSNQNQLSEFIHNINKEFDIMVDDGGHTMQQQIITFQEFFPYLKSGGIYVIEDLHTSYWKHYGGHGTLSDPKADEGSTIHFLKSLIDDINYVGARTSCANKNICPEEILQSLTYWQKQIKSMHFYDSLCFIIKN